MTFEEIAIQIREFRDERDWMRFHNPKDMAIAISLEASELLEHFLWKSAAEIDAVATTRRQQIEEEVADIAIFLFEFADNLGIDLLTAMQKKIQVNREKYPVSKSKGSSAKYTDL
jgi:dCTP diphosphatase